VIFWEIGCAGLAFLLAYWLTGRLCSPVSKLRLLDYPNERSLHVSPTTRTGGIAILGGLVVGVLLDNIVSRATDLSFTDNRLWMVNLAVLLGVVSFWDDRVSLPSGIRLGIHTLAALAMVWVTDLTLNAIAVPLLGTLSLGVMAVPVTILFLVWMTNLYNFMDGMDGFAGGMTVLGYGFLGYVAWRGGHHTIAVLSLLIVGATGGFLWYNLPPAQIFMGDIGSVPLGFLTAALAVLGTHDGLFDIWVPLLIFSPFIADATVTLFRRLLRSEKVWQAHREHYYQRLVLAGWGHRKTVLAEYILMLACGISAVVYVQVSEPWRMAILLGWMAVYTVLMRGVCVVERQAKVVGAAG
jgi:UDP-N-acetylmuramyl pentapeptide phosphotransferase/UDP-N-acetylglucosamine-1-phosphate transferase